MFLPFRVKSVSTELRKEPVLVISPIALSVMSPVIVVLSRTKPFSSTSFKEISNALLTVIFLVKEFSLVRFATPTPRSKIVSPAIFNSELLA